MDDRTVSPDELLAWLPEQRRRQIAWRGAQLIAEERAGRGESPYPDRPDGPGALEQTQGANDADV